MSSAFQTPEVIRLFAQKQPDALRTRLAHLQREAKLKHIATADFNQQATEILVALKKLDITVCVVSLSYRLSSLLCCLSSCLRSVD